MKFYIREIYQDDKVDSLSLGDPNLQPLKTFLKEQAKELHRENITKTYILVNENIPNKVIGYISLVCSEITIENNQRAFQSMNIDRYKTFPAIKIARLAIDRNIQKQGLGSFLLRHAMHISKNFISPMLDVGIF